MSTTVASSYASNVASATRGFFDALLAFKAETPSATQRMRNIRQLFSLANQYDSLTPNLASELRYFAGKL